MLYLFYRYIIGLNAFFVVAISLALVIFFSNPDQYSAIGQTQNFGPLLTLLHIFTVLLALFAILFTHPFITDGEETLAMNTPVSHASIQGNVVLMITMAFLQLSATKWHVEFFTSEIVNATAFILRIAIASTITSCIGFYAVRHRAAVKKRRGEDINAFCLKSSFTRL